MTKLQKYLLGFGLVGLVLGCQQTVKEPLEVAPISIIPLPVTVKPDSGAFVFSADTRIRVSHDDQRQMVQEFVQGFAKVGTWTPSIVDGESLADITLISDDHLPTEGYTLDISSQTIVIKASSQGGFLYALQTLVQLLPPSFFSTEQLQRPAWAVPAVYIEDAPAFPWRGFMLDVSRHFFNIEQVKQVLDLMAGLKLNRFHWHLTDDQGWRVEIKEYPKLTSIGAWRTNYINYDEDISDWWGRPQQQPGDKPDYGGFYTPADIREIVQYAKDRNIEVIPEIDMPGHAQATIAAYPEIGCINAAPYVATGGVFKNNTYNPGKEETFEFIQQVLNEVMELFPYEYIHIGGDECNKEQWQLDPHAQHRMRTEGLKDEKELQSYFIERVEQMVNAAGKKMIGWDEILEGGLAPNATVMSWRGEDGGIAAARAGHDVIMTPAKYCYLDLKQGPDDQEPNLGYSHMFLRDAYQYKLIPDSFNEQEAGHVLGTQANLWTESITDWGKFTYMTFPRIFAVAENGWTPESLQDWDQFATRLRGQLARLDTMKVRYASSAYNVNIRHMGVEEGVKISLDTEVNNLKYFYTVDGQEPDTASLLYQSPFVAKDGADIKARAFDHNYQALGKTTHLQFPIHLGSKASVNYHTPYLDYKDAAGIQALVDYNYGSLTVTSDNWQGFKDNLEVDFNFPDLREVKEVQITSLRMTISGIYVPENFQIFGSQDGQTYILLGESQHLDISHTQGRNKVTITIPFTPTEIRSLKVKAGIVNPIPEGHHRAGESSRLYLDEVVIL